MTKTEPATKSIPKPLTKKQLLQKRKRQREWKMARKREFFADKVCTRCGATHDLQLDHIDPATKTDHRIWSWSKERREAEIRKCQVLCGPCHKEKSTENGDYHYERKKKW